MSDKLKVRFLVFFGKYGTKSRISFYYNDLIFTLFLNKPHSRYKQKREVKSTSLSFSVDNSALFQHSDTFDMMCLRKHINRLYLREFESFCRQEFDISCHCDRVARNV